MTERNFDATLFSIERWQGSVPFCRLSGPFIPSLPDTWGEQADPLMPLFFSLAIHNTLNEAKQEMLDGEELFAFLDDVRVEP